MKALILAAGYATRLRPLTDSIPKQLLPVGGRPMVDWILDRIEETSADEVHLVTNARFAEDFARWAEAKDVRTTGRPQRGPTRRNRGHALVGLDDDLLVVAGDEPFYSLAEYERSGASATAAASPFWTSRIGSWRSSTGSSTSTKTTVSRISSRNRRIRRRRFARQRRISTNAITSG